MSEYLTELGVSALALIAVLQVLSFARPMLLDWLRNRRRGNSDNPPPSQGAREDTGQFVIRDLHHKVSSLHDALGARHGRRSVVEEKQDRHEQLIQALVENSRKQTQILEHLSEGQRKIRKTLGIDSPAH